MRSRIWITVLSLALSAAALAGKERSFAFSAIGIPGALQATAFGINAGGEIVGSYRDATGVHGFLLSRGVLTTIDYPGAQGTEARGISPAGEIVGTYWMPGEPAPNVHGFLLTRAGEFLPADYPGHISTIPQRILPDGTILGCRHDTDTMGTMRGVVMARDGNEETSAFASMHNGATPDRSLIVGLFTNMMTGRVEGYVIENGGFTPFVVAGPGVIQTAAWDVNPRGEIVGVFRNAAGFHGFVRFGDDYTTVDFPGATATRVFGINAGGDIVGHFVLGGVTQAFVASRTHGR